MSQPVPENGRKPCDLMIAGGLIIALNEECPRLADGAIAIVGNRIDAVGHADELEREYVAARRIAAVDKIVMPGLVNTHTHSPLMIVRGMVEDLGFAPAYTPNIPQGHALSFEQALALSRLGVYELLRFGSTTVVDYYNHPVACAQAIAELGLRGLVAGRIHDVDTEALSHGERRYVAAIGDATMRENLDLIEHWQGKADGRIRVGIAPHAADTCSRELLERVADVARQSGLTVHTHLAQSDGEVECVLARDNLQPSQLFDELGLLNSKLIAGHCIHLNSAEIARVGAAGVRVAHSPFGNAVSGRIAPIKALQDAGATITLCTDTKTGDMFETMRLAISAARIKGAGYDINAETALRWATGNGAEALGMDDDIGQLKPGMLADLILLDANSPNMRPVVAGPGIVVYSGMGMNVDTVIVDGRILLENGQAVGFDAAEIVGSAQQVADELWSAYGAC